MDLEQEGYRRLELKEAEKLWRFWYEWTDTKCIHGEAPRQLWELFMQPAERQLCRKVAEHQGSSRNWQ